jgi:CubicO group peptidase (beta-lactamase class C family)
VLALLGACGAPPSDEGAVDTTAAWPGDDWEVRAPADDGLDPVALQDAIGWAMSDERSTQALLVAHRGRLVAEAYDPEHVADDLATSWSMAKSMASVLVGIAVDRGELGGFDETFTDVFPAWADDDRATITLDALIAMRSGLAWGAPPNEELELFLATPDQLAVAADRELEHPVGSTWKYSSGDAMLVSGILEHYSGERLTDYAQEHLFGPLGMTATWWTDVDGHALTYCCVDATPRDLLRFGLMAARGGAWGEQRVVSEDWLDATTAAQEDAPWYGGMWWTYLDDVTVHGEPVRSFVADGLGNQRTYVFPSLDLVVLRVVKYARTGTGYVRSGTTMPITPAQTTEAWSDGELVGRVLRALDPEAKVGPVCRDEEDGACGGS